MVEAMPPFREFYDSHVRFVWRALLRLGVHESDLPDAVQDVFVVVHRKLAEFEGRSKVTTWLFAICARVASDRRRMAHVRREVPSGDVPSPALGGDGEEALVDRRRAGRLLETILDRMPEAQRIVFCLFELDEMTGDEIAEVLDVPVGTVRSRLRLARETFWECVSRLQARQRGQTRALLKAVEA
jgi:RNA polymerase sigma-70 factor, ECF subfamily